MTNPNKNQGIPDMLYHYTTQEGFMGIVESGSIRATNIFYLNDSQEYYQAEIFFEEARKEKLISPAEVFRIKMDDHIKGNRSSKLDINTILNSLPDSMKQIKKLFPIHVCCFSGNKNDLSQWINYSKDATGYCLGFKKSNLSDLLPTDAILLNCEYEEKKQKEEAKQ